MRTPRRRSRIIRVQLDGNARGMSVDLDWSLLSAELTEKLRERINGVLAGVPLPDFLERIEVQTLDLGQDVPDVQLSHVGDVWAGFRQGAAGTSASSGTDVGAGGSDGASSFSAAAAGAASNFPFAPGMRLRTYRQYEGNRPESVHTDVTSMVGGEDMDDSMMSSWSDMASELDTESVHTADSKPAPTSSFATLPSFQSHFSVYWPTTSIQAELQTCLRIFYAGKRVMSLPIHLTLTALEFAAQVIVALDGDARCVHVSLVEDPASHAGEAGLSGPVRRLRRASNTRAAQRILPYLAFDSCVGEPEKNVLENVGKVEKFVDDMVRQVLESELIFPNFYTVYF